MFPSLLYVRDMSGVSGYMRRVGRVQASSSSLSSSTHSDASATSFSHHLSTSASTPTLWRLPLSRPQPTSSSSSKAKKVERMRLMKEERDGRRILKFWKNVLERCKERGVWLEDWEGVPVTFADLRRAKGVELGVCELACVRHHRGRLFLIFSLSLTRLFVVTTLSLRRLRSFG